MLLHGPTYALIPLIAQQVTVSASVSQTLQVTAQSVSVTVVAPGISASVSQTLQQAVFNSAAMSYVRIVSFVVEHSHLVDKEV